MRTWGKLVKILIGLTVVGLALGACAGTEPEPSKRAVLAQMLATSAQLFVEREGGIRRSGSGVILSTGLPEGRVAIITTALSEAWPQPVAASPTAAPIDTAWRFGQRRWRPRQIPRRTWGRA